MESVDMSGVVELVETTVRVYYNISMGIVSSQHNQPKIVHI